MTATDGDGPDRASCTPAGAPTAIAGLHAGGHPGGGQGPRQRRPRARWAPRWCWPTPTTSCSGPAPTRWPHLGGLHRFTGWSGPHPHRLGRLPGPLAPADGRRRRRHLRLGLRRHAGPPDPRIGRRGPGSASGPTSRWCSTSAPPCRPPTEVLRVAVDRTAAWAGRARRHHDRLEAGPRARPSSASSRAAPTRACGPRAPERTVALGFDGYGIGGLSVGEPRPAMLEALAATVPHLPADRPRYLMGVGDPVGTDRGGGPRGRPVRLRGPDPDGPARVDADPTGPPQPPQRRARHGRRPPRPGLRLPHLRAVVAGVSAPPAGGGGAHRLAPAQHPQPGLRARI